MSLPLRPLNCPNCAAPLPPGSSPSCPYCATAFQPLEPPPRPPTTPSAAERIAAELAIGRLTTEIEQTRAEVEKVESAHSTRLGCGCIGLLLAIFGLFLLIAAVTDRSLSPWSGILALAIGAWFARKGHAAYSSDPASPLQQRLVKLQSELNKARHVVISHASN